MSADPFDSGYTFAACLLIGAIPTFLAGTAYTAAELYALRFFIGILGGMQLYVFLAVVALRDTD